MIGSLNPQTYEKIKTLFQFHYGMIGSREFMKKNN